MERTTELRTAVERLISEHNTWAADTAKPNPTQGFWDALDEVFTRFSGEIPAECVNLDVAVRKLEMEYLAFINAVVGGQYPQQDFWRAYESVVVAHRGVEVKPLTPLPSIPDLVRQGVSGYQICKMYGLMDAQQRPQIELIQKEMDDPGSVIGPDWVDPRLKDGPLLVVTKSADETRKAKAAANKAKKHEIPLDELFRQGVDYQQAAKMLVMDEATVAAEYDKLARADAEGKLNSEIAGLLAAGKKVKAVAVMLNTTEQRVREVAKSLAEVA